MIYKTTPKSEVKPMYSEPMEDCYRIFDKVNAVLEMKPDTWEAYEGTKDGLFNIIRMEYNEFEIACSTGTYHDKLKELIHLASAITHAYEEMTCPNK